MALNPVAPPTKAAAAFERLRDAIQSGELPPGARLPLTKTAEELGMSLTPVREAMRLLASQGLVVYTPHLGNVVAEYSWDEAREIYSLRMVLEPMAVERACSLATVRDLDDLADLQRIVDEAIGSGQVHRVPDLNRDFHLRLYSLARSKYLNEFIETLWWGLPFQTVSLTDRVVHSSQEHHEILEAMRARDPGKAAELMRTHIAAAAARAEEVWRR